MKTKKIVKVTCMVLLFIAFFIILGCIFYVFYVINDVNLDKNALSLEENKRTEINDTYGNKINFNYAYKRFVPYEEISPYTINAFVSMEDKRFFQHSGLDLKRILGATLNNIKAGYFKEGGSTITQQLAKNALLSNEKTLERKLKEAKLSIEIEKNFTKEEIISLYLNNIYFGHSLYGIESASKRLFDKDPLYLTIAESAMLAGIVQNPLNNSPLNNVENALKRRNLVLKLMLEQNYISNDEYNNALKEEYQQPIIKESTNTNIPYVQVVIEEGAKILNITEKEVISSGFIIETYYEPNKQKIIDGVYNEKDLTIENAEKLLLLVDNDTCGVTAYNGSINYSPFIFRRQSASTLKPLVSYLTALEQGKIYPDSPILDEKLTIDGYSPKNYKNSYRGWTTIKESLTHSSNAVSLRLLSEVGTSNAINTLKEMGFYIDEEGLALALGATKNGQTPIELIGAYTAIANGGKYNAPTFIKAIYNRENKCIYRHERGDKQVFSEKSAYFLTDMLKECATQGTAKKLNVLPFEIASKTGTNGNESGNYDAWNISFTTQNTLCTWYGSQDYKKPLPLSVGGGGYPTVTAKHVFASLPIPQNFIEPSGLEYIEIDNFSLKNNHILTLANEKTPLEYRKSVLLPKENYLPVSNYFDNALPNDFNVVLGDGEVYIILTKSEKFNYYIKNSTGERLVIIEKGIGKCEFALPMPRFKLEFYSITAFTDDGIEVESSYPKAIFRW